MKKALLLILLSLLFILQSCTTKKEILYLQDIDQYSNTDLTYATTRIQPNDILKIEVIDLNPIVAAPFNINVGSGGQISVEMMKLNGYLVTPLGYVTMPILNEVNVGGLTPSDAESLIKDRLINEGYLLNPTVLVRVLNNKFTVLGEVNLPSVITFTEESISLLDALGRAGNLTYSGIRTDVVIIRELDGKRLVYHVDLTTASWMSNPDYRIRQNDVILVAPNRVKANSGRLIKDPLQILGVLTTVLALYLLIKK